MTGTYDVAVLWAASLGDWLLAAAAALTLLTGLFLAALTAGAGRASRTSR